LNRVYAWTFKIATQNPGVTGLFSAWPREEQLSLCEMNKRATWHPPARELTTWPGSISGRRLQAGILWRGDFLLLAQGVTRRF
jgi:hypothetical protein